MSLRAATKSLALLPALAAFAICVSAARSATLHVDDDAPGDPGPNNPAISDPLENGAADHPFDRIQEAVAAAANGDIILVAPGTYREHVNMLGKTISLRSTDGPSVTVLDGNNSGTVLRCVSGEPRSTSIEGFTIRNGNDSGTASGVACSGSSPTIRGNVIVNNRGLGGAISAFDNSDPLIADNVIEDNNGAAGGGGLHCSDSAATVRGNRFSRNVSDLEVGGAIHAVRSRLVVTDNEFVENLGLGGAALHVFDCPSVDVRRNRFIRNDGVSLFAGFQGAVTWYNSPGTLADNLFFANRGDLGGAVFISDSSPLWRNNTIVATRSSGAFQDPPVFASGAASFFLRSSILWDNGPFNNIGGSAAANVQVVFCDVQGGASGTGNLDLDPRFVDQASGDLRLAANSPCRDAGDPAFVPAADDGDVDNEPRLVGGRVDIGADEFVIRGDANLDGQVTIIDIGPFVETLLGQEVDPRIVHVCDVSKDGATDGGDVRPFLVALGAL